jgi:hypothetical protein
MQPLRNLEILISTTAFHDFSQTTSRRSSDVFKNYPNMLARITSGILDDVLYYCAITTAYS